MCRNSPFVVSLPDSDRAELRRRSCSRMVPYWQVLRARIVLAAASGERNTVIAARLDVHVNMVSKWRARYAREGLAGLADRKSLFGYSCGAWRV